MENIEIWEVFTFRDTEELTLIAERLFHNNIYIVTGIHIILSLDESCPENGQACQKDHLIKRMRTYFESQK